MSEQPNDRTDLQAYYEALVRAQAMVARPIGTVIARREGNSRLILHHKHIFILKPTGVTKLEI